MPIQTQNRIIYIQEHKGGAAGNVLRIRQKCIQGNRGPNIGTICLGSDRHPNTDIHHLDRTEDLINDIGSMGGNFLTSPRLLSTGPFVWDQDDIVMAFLPPPLITANPPAGQEPRMFRGGDTDTCMRLFRI